MIDALPETVGILAAAIGGAAIGVERQWSGHASGPHARLGGVRTFTLLGGIAGLSGWLWRGGFELPAAVLLAGCGALVVASYVAASRGDVEGTTEAAGLVVLAAGFLAGLGALRVASAVVALTVLLLVEKSRLHAWVRRIDDTELRAGARFAVMAVVVLPLLPVGPWGPLGGVRPRALWALVLLFSGLSFVGYVARRVAGAERGYRVAGLLGGLLSSTSVTLMFSRASRASRAPEAPLATGVVAACTVMFARMLVATVILSSALAAALVAFVVPPLVVGLAVVLAARGRSGQAAAGMDDPQNPLAFGTALQMALLFQVVLWAVYLVRETWGSTAVVISGALLGFADVDALTVSMAHSVSSGLPVEVAARTLAVGAFANGVLKLVLTLVLGSPGFRRRVAPALVLLALAAAAPLVVWR